MHISVVVKMCEGELRHQAFIHVVERCSQDSDAVVAIMEHTLRTLKTEHPDILSAFYRSDNAGCYHSTRWNINQLLNPRVTQAHHD